MKLNSNQKSGVTLIELIIVVVIIGVLSTLAITKFAQGNFSEKARIARLTDFATKMAASARHARDSDGFEALNLSRQVATSQWDGAENGTTAAMRNYMTSLSEEVDVYITVPNGEVAGPVDDIWNFEESDEVLILKDEAINNLSTNDTLTGADKPTWLVLDKFGEIIHCTQAEVDNDFGDRRLIHD